MKYCTIAATGETYMNDVDQRLKILLDNASENLNKSIVGINQSQIDVANGRTAFFDRLTIGAGAVIAALISFLGSHASTLRPEWSLRCSLISLTLAILAGLYRSFRYPYYIIRAKKVIWIEAARYHQKIKGELIVASGPIIDLNTGNPINTAKVSKEYGASDIELENLINEESKVRDNLLKECHSAEAVCLAAIGVAMVSLVYLALCTF
jgi:hypothetical protein